MISKLVEAKTKIKYLVGYLDKLVLILPKMIGYFIAFTFKDGDKDKNKNRWWQASRKI